MSPDPRPLSRPRRLVVVAGTGTEIGKTWVSVALARAAVSGGWTIEARKPAQSGVPGDPTDADALAAATGEVPDRVCPPHRSYTVPMAPPMAAESLGLPVPAVAELVSETTGSWGPRSADLGLVELAGGVASPAAGDGDGADLAAALEPDGVVLVADAGLGTINAVRLTRLRLLAATGREPLVMLNRYDHSEELHRRNRRWLAERDGLHVVSSIDELLASVIRLAPPHCGHCGRPATTCDGSCARPLDPERFCRRCGRRLVVAVSPTAHTARCKVHGGTHGDVQGAPAPH